jgi:hypothetical protein
LPDGDDRRQAGADDHERADPDERVGRTPLGERADPERVRIEDPVVDEVVKRARGEGVRDRGDPDAGEQGPDRPPPPGGRWMPIGEQQHEER